MNDIESLWGEDFSPDNTDATIINKLQNPKKVKTTVSKTLKLEDKLENIKSSVYSILGKHASDTLVIRDKNTLHQYIDKAIDKGFIAVDTETNNSLDPLTCKLMGLCLYVNNDKQVYIPINHVDLHTHKLLENQLTTDDLREELERIVQTNTKVIFHNAQFDIRVIECTCNIELTAYWDTSIACKVLNNTEDAKLKTQYVLHVDPNHGKYDIEHLFEKEKYEIIDPDIFALYAATDAMMTYRLYEYQLNELKKEENKRLLALLLDIEMPLVKVVKDMVQRGISIDTEYWSRLKKKYDTQLESIEKKIQVELDNLKPKIDAWRLSEDAKTIVSGKKTKSEQLEENINLSSTTQLSILLYDVLKVPVVNKKKPRSTDEEAINDIYKKTNLSLCGLLIERRGYIKLLSTYIDNITPLLNHWKDGKVRTGFNQYGTDTGRFSSGGKIKFINEETDKREEISLINLQTIPSHNKEIRLMFCGSKELHDIDCEDNHYEISKYDDVKIDENKWIKASTLKVGDLILTSENTVDKIINIEEKDNKLILSVN